MKGSGNRLGRAKPASPSGKASRLQSPRRLPAKLRRDQLLDEAAKQLNARGVLMTSLTDIADTLGVSRNALYHYVEDREDLVFQVYRRACEILTRALGEAARSGRPALQVVAGFIASALDPREPEIAALGEIGLLRPAERETVVGLHEGVVARLASLLKTGMAAGEVRPCDPVVAARCIVGAISWAPLAAHWTRDVNAGRPALIAAIVNLLETGVATDREATIDPPWIDLTPLQPARIAAFDRAGLAAAKREAILLAASRLFNAKGVDPTSLDEIAEAANATKRAIYQHVGDKQALVSACYERAYRIFFYSEDQAAALGLSAQEASFAISRAGALARLDPDINPLRPLIGFEALNAEQKTQMDAHGHTLFLRTRDRLSRMQADGDLRADVEIDMLMLVLPGIGTWLAGGAAAYDEPQRRAVADEVAALMRIGLAPVPSPQAADA
ncbi:MAG: TetR/AcrR family transcriptional regulator [Phenylobacterium sp.]|nr:TetR/AcrR family transcriptional regulator [Phenylobacterium sp.]